MAIKLAKKDIEARRDFVSKAEALCDVVQKFNGKVFNKRLETAMREVYPVKVEHGFSWKSLSITGYVEDRMVRNDQADKWGYHRTEYIKEDRIYFGTTYDAFDDDKRIIAEAIIKQIRSTADYYRESADKMEEQLGRIDEIIAECKRINAEKSRFMHETNCTICEYFDLKV